MFLPPTTSLLVYVRLPISDDINWFLEDSLVTVGGDRH